MAGTAGWHTAGMLPLLLLVVAVGPGMAEWEDNPSPTAATEAAADPWLAPGSAAALGAVAGEAVGAAVLVTVFLLAPIVTTPLAVPLLGGLIPLTGTIGAAAGLLLVGEGAPPAVAITALAGLGAAVLGAGVGFAAYGIPALSASFRQYCCGGHTDGGWGLVTFAAAGAGAVSGVVVPIAAALSAELLREE